jgi:hypothetical protein
MGKVLTGITISADGFVTGPGESPGLKHPAVRQSPFAAFTGYRMQKAKAGS